MIVACLDQLDVDWMQALRSLKQKKFGKSPPAGYREQAKQSRFLQHRGYTTDQIRRLYKSSED
jgi:regulatory protein